MSLARVKTVINSNRFNINNFELRVQDVLSEWVFGTLQSLFHLILTMS